MPYSDTRLLNVLSRTLWFLPNMAACYAMRNLLAQRQNRIYHDYAVSGSAVRKWESGQARISRALWERCFKGKV